MRLVAASHALGPDSDDGPTPLEWTFNEAGHAAALAPRHWWAEPLGAGDGRGPLQRQGRYLSSHMVGRRP